MSFKSIVNRRTMNGRRTKTDHKSSPCHYVTRELKTSIQVKLSSIFQLILVRFAWGLKQIRSG